MSRVVPVLLIVVLARLSAPLTVNPNSNVTWTYARQDLWAAQSPTCASSQQSPIAIVETGDTIYDSTMAGKLKCAYLKNRTPMTGLVRNDGHTIAMAFNRSAANACKGVPLAVNQTALYDLVAIDLHWGETDTNGTEHSVNGLSGALEVHYVHILASYPSIQAASAVPDGVFIIASRFEVVDDGTGDRQLGALGALANTTAIQTGNYVPFHIVPQDVLSGTSFPLFYSYRGSLTAPPCSQSVIWAFVSGSGSVDPATVASLRAAARTDGTSLTPNVRAQHEDNGRPLYASWDQGSEFAVSTTGIITGIIVAFSVVIVITAVAFLAQYMKRKDETRDLLHYHDVEL